MLQDFSFKIVHRPGMRQTRISVKKSEILQMLTLMHFRKEQNFSVP
jgi:hypothetical protein